MLALLAACGSESTVPAEQPGRYTRPDFAKLWREMEMPPGDFEERGEGNPMERAASAEEAYRAAYRALWRSVESAEEQGLLELYGMESATNGDPGYRALFFVRTAKGVSCLYAHGDLHKSRADKETIPALPVPEAAFERLRRRVGIEIPFPLASSMTSQIDDGAWALLHVYRDGKLHSALWYAPYDDPSALREGAARSVNLHPIVAVIGALSAAAPPRLYPRDEVPMDREISDEEWWEYDAAEVYGRLPGYGPNPGR